MKAKTLIMTLMLALLAGCGTGASGAPAAPTDPVTAWAAAVKDEDTATATGLMAGDTTGVAKAIRSAQVTGHWERVTVVGGPTPVAEGQQYALHWERPQSSPEHQHRCSLVVLDAAGKIRADGKYVSCGPFEPFVEVSVPNR